MEEGFLCFSTDYWGNVRLFCDHSGKPVARRVFEVFAVATLVCFQEIPHVKGEKATGQPASGLYQVSNISLSRENLF